MLSIGQSVRITGGPFNGFEGRLAKAGEVHCSVVIGFEGRTHEVVTELRFLTPLEAFLAGKSDTEKSLLGHTP